MNCPTWVLNLLLPFAIHIEKVSHWHVVPLLVKLPLVIDLDKETVEFHFSDGMFKS